MIKFNNEVYELEIKGLRKMLHDDVDDTFHENVHEPTEEDYDDLEKVHSLISAQDVDTLVGGFWANGEICFEKVESDDMLAEALEQAGYNVEKSNASRSLYAINDNGEEVRISDHKRPAIVEGNVAYEHEYDSELIVKDNIVSLNQLKAKGFSKLNKSEYVLG